MESPAARTRRQLDAATYACWHDDASPPADGTHPCVHCGRTATSTDDHRSTDHAHHDASPVAHTDGGARARAAHAH